MFFHLFLNERNSFCRNIASEVVKTGELPEKGKKSITNCTSQFCKITCYFFSLVEFSEVGDLDHFPFKVSPVPEEVTLMKLVELIPHFLGVILCFFILFFG